MLVTGFGSSFGGVFLIGLGGITSGFTGSIGCTGSITATGSGALGGANSMVNSIGFSFAKSNFKLGSVIARKACNKSDDTIAQISVESELLGFLITTSKMVGVRQY